MVTNKRLTVLYGSQTFTAQEIAEKIWRTTKFLGFGGPVQPMDEYHITKLIHEEFAIFVCATTGQGEEPDNMKLFWRFLLKRNLPPNSLQKLKFGVLALGDSSYAKFNFVGKKLHKRLIQLGATPLLDAGLCDYQHDLGHDAVMGPWLDKFWLKLKEYYPDITRDENVVDRFIPRWRVQLLRDVSDRLQPSLEELTRDIYFNETRVPSFIEPVQVELESNTRTTSEEHFQDVRLLSFKMADESPLTYKPGDVFNLRPRNSREDVEELFSIFRTHNMDIQPHYRLKVQECHGDMPVPKFLQEPLTMFDIAEQYWDLRFIPTQYVFSLLELVSEDSLERDKCRELRSAAGQEEWLNYCKRPRRTILEVLQDFHKSTSKLTIEILFELFSPIKPRSFSIASSAAATGRQRLDLLVAVVHYYSKMKSPRLGLASNWLKTLQPKDRVYGWFKKGTFMFPEEPNTPCILIGPGTGLAPFRSLVLEREAQGTATADVLFMLFGCRYAAHDFHCHRELQQLQSDGKLTLICAFSRDQENKIYVQHKIAEHADLMWELVSEKKAMVFIAGNGKNMPDNVKDAFVEVFQGVGGLSPEEARDRIRKMEAVNILQIETW